MEFAAHCLIKPLMTEFPLGGDTEAILVVEFF